MADDLLEVRGQVARVQERRRLREEVARVDPPSAVRADVLAAVVIPVHGDHVGRRISPSLDVVEPDLIGRLPVARVDQLAAAEVVPIVVGHLLIESALGLAEECELIADPSRFARVAGLEELPDFQESDAALGEVVAGGLGVVPRLLGLVERPVFLGEPGREFLPEAFFLLGLEPHHGPEQEAVLVLDLDQGHARVARERDSGIGILGRVEGADPGLVAALQGLVEEQQAPEVGLAGISGDLPSRGFLAGRPVGRDRDVNPLLLRLGDEPPDLVDLLLIGVGDPGIRGGRRDLGMKADHVHADLGEEPDVTGYHVGRLRVDRRADGPEPRGRAVAQDEIIAVRRESDEPRLPRDFLVQAAKVEHGRGGARMSRVRERPGAVRGGGPASLASGGPLADQGQGQGGRAAQEGRALAGHDGSLASVGGSSRRGWIEFTMFRARPPFAAFLDPGSLHRVQSCPSWHDPRTNPRPLPPGLARGWERALASQGDEACVEQVAAQERGQAIANQSRPLLGPSRNRPGPDGTEPLGMLGRAVKPVGDLERLEMAVGRGLGRL